LENWKKMRKLWPFAFYFLLFAAIASVAPFMVLYYQGLGFTGTQIGLLTGITPLITFFSAPLWTGLADASHRHRRMMSLAILAGVTTLFVFPLLNAFVPVLLVAALLSSFTAPVTPFADSATIPAVVSSETVSRRSSATRPRGKPLLATGGGQRPAPIRLGRIRSAATWIRAAT
jgi:MFS family permease